MPIQLVENSIVAGRFRLNRMIGRGGMGSVWHATHLGLDIPCAVKFMEGESSQSPEAQARFEREAKSAAQLRSPHVVQILDHGVSDGTPYIAMELLDGEDLGKRLQRLGVLHPRDLSVIVTQVCRALTKAHAMGIVHRDLKPDNIFLVHDDDREIAKVLDFGIAKSSAATLEGSNTKTGAMLGTPYYMSPEQAQGVKTVDFRSDLWSLAVIVYQCATGRLPFESEALGDLLMKIIIQPLPVPSQVANVAPGFDAWWERASSRDPGGRFQSAKEFAESLQIVFGVSQATDSVDMPQIRAMLASTPNPAQRTAALAQSNPLARSNPLAISATTGAPMARTFSEEGAPPLPVKKSGMVVALASIVVVIGIAAGVVTLAMKKPTTSTASAGATTEAVAAPKPPPAISPPPVVAAVAQPTAAIPQSAASLVTPPPAPAVADEPAPKPSSHHGGGNVHGAVPPPAARRSRATSRRRSRSPLSPKRVTSGSDRGPLWRGAMRRYCGPCAPCLPRSASPSHRSPSRSPSSRSRPRRTRKRPPIERLRASSGSTDRPRSTRRTTPRRRIASAAPTRSFTRRRSSSDTRGRRRGSGRW